MYMLTSTATRTVRMSSASCNTPARYPACSPARATSSTCPSLLKWFSSHSRAWRRGQS
jgi:hypothetical protein